MSFIYRFLLIFFIPYSVFSQSEASNWYFGYNAGIQFDNLGNVTTLTDGQLATVEGCATISSSSGDLLFYTDGITIWNKNHVVMPNGTGLTGDPSSTQSATIVPLPGSSTLFYVFTLDAYGQADGFRYSIVDMSLDSGNGEVVTKNILIYTPSCEKIAVVKHANNNDFWIVTHGWNNTTFYSYLLTNSGLSAVPIQTNIGVNVTSSNQDNAIGYMKISPDGTKLALCHYFGVLQLFNFNASTGIISNEQTLYTGPVGSALYGLEFSSNSEVLYFTQELNTTKVFQLDLTSSNITSTLTTVFDNSNPFAMALQLGPDEKIYVAQLGSTKLGVIHDPNILGSSCNLQMNYIDLNGKYCMRGLPPFVSTFFYNPSIIADNACVGQSTSFELQTNQTITSATWNFGDGNSSTDIEPTHTYTAPGTYSVSVIATSPQGTGTKTRDIVISAVPTATQPQDIIKCDIDNNGFYAFDLTSQNAVILNGQSSSQYSVKYFASATDFTSNIAIPNPTAYQNTTAYLSQTIIAEVSNNANGDCKATTSFAIQVFESPMPAVSNTINPIKSCDNTTVGTDNDGKILFDLTQRATTILNGQSASAFTLTYYKDNALTQVIATPLSYSNTNPTEAIWVKVTNNQNTNCFAVTSFNIEVFSLPVVNTPITLKQCDDNQDGFSAFNLEEAIPLISSTTNGLTFSFFESSTQAQNNTNPITNTGTYTNQIVNTDTVFVRVENTNGCYRVVQLNLVVSTTQIPVNFMRSFTVCDDVASGSNTDGIATFDFSSADLQIRALFPAGQLLDITYYKSIADALTEQNAINNISNYTNIGYPISQNIYVRVDSQLNNECLGLGYHITLNVERIPIVQPKILKHCDDNQDGVYAFNTSNLQSTLLNGLTNASVSYTDQNGNTLPSPLPNPFATTSQTITVTIANNTTAACNYTSTIQFIVDDLPEVFPLPNTLTTVCDDEIDPGLQDGLYPFDTSTFQATILGTQTGMIVKYFDENNNLLSSPLPNPFQSGSQNILVEVTNPVNNSCKATMIIPLVVNQVPIIDLTGEELVCSNDLTFTKFINSGLIDETTINDYNYTWYFNGNVIPFETNYSLTVNMEGIYTVDVTNSNGCVRTRTITVTASNVATITNIEVSDLSEDNSIIVHVTGQGDYVYSLDNVTFQQSNVFYDITPGIYTVYVKDLNDCGIADQEVSVLGIPNFFTPNGDGINDYWNIKGVGKTYGNTAKIYIFNRYGKLIKQLSPQSNGWNGMYNNQPAPSSDYWYSIELNDGRVLKGHFALKR